MSMNIKVKLGIFITLYLLVLAVISFSWMKTIRMQSEVKPRKLQVRIFKPSSENMLIREDEIARNVKFFYKKDWHQIPLEALQVSRLEAELEKLHVVHHAEVYMDAVENLHVDVYQRDPLFRVMGSDGEQYYVDIEGKKIPASENYSARVPVVTGILEGLAGNDIWGKANVNYRNAYRVITEISKDPFTRSLIEQVDLDAGGEMTLIPKIGFEKISFGHAEELDEKLDKLKFFYREGLRYEGWNVYKVLNLKVKDQVIGVRNTNQI